MFFIAGDIHKASANIKSHLPGAGSSPDASKKLEQAGSDAGAKLDKAVSSLPTQLSLQEKTKRFVKADANLCSSSVAAGRQESASCP